VAAHNVETVERLTPRVRDRRAAYRQSLEVLRTTSAAHATKSSIMLGLGERRDEVLQAMRDLRSVGCDILTLAQYLRPTEKHCPSRSTSGRSVRDLEFLRRPQVLAEGEDVAADRTQVAHRLQHLVAPLAEASMMDDLVRMPRARKCASTSSDCGTRRGGRARWREPLDGPTLCAATVGWRSMIMSRRRRRPGSRA